MKPVIVLLLAAICLQIQAAQDESKLWMGKTVAQLNAQFKAKPAAARNSKKKSSYSYVLYRGSGGNPYVWIFRKGKCIGYVTAGAGPAPAAQIAQILKTHQGDSSWVALREMEESTVDKKTGSPFHFRMQRWRRKDREIYVANLWARSDSGELTLLAIGNRQCASVILNLSGEIAELTVEVFGTAGSSGRTQQR